MNMDKSTYDITYILLYLVCLSLFRGFVVPDFRYGVISIVGIHLIFPLMIVISMLLLPNSFFLLNRIKMFFIGLISIVLSQGVAVSVFYFDGGKDAFFDGLSIPILINSFVAQLVVYIILFLLVSIFKKSKKLR